MERLTAWVGEQEAEAFLRLDNEPVPTVIQACLLYTSLMAEAPGRQALVFDLEPLTVPVLGTDTHHLRPRYHAVFPGNAQAALQPCLLYTSRCV